MNKTYTESEINSNLLFLTQLAKAFPTVENAMTEIVNLSSILALPKPTEHFMSDLHGQGDAFEHILNNASGVIRNEIERLFANTLTYDERETLATIVYYPRKKIALELENVEDADSWYRYTLRNLIVLGRKISSKYTRSKLRKTLDPDFAYIIEELLTARVSLHDLDGYYDEIFDSIIRHTYAEPVIVALTDAIKKLAVDRLHIVGDIYDRGTEPHKILDLLLKHPSVDIQWGNHDILWMGASAGNNACICNVLRLSLRYANLATLEEGYGINLVPLATFAMETYANDPCTEFQPKLLRSNDMDEKTRQLTAKMHKAIAILQFKEEARLFKRHPEWGMTDRCLFNNIDYDRAVCTIDGKEYAMTSCLFPTIDPQNPDRLTPEEEQLLEKLRHSFAVSEKLHKHISTILSHGCMYAIYNSNLLFHASIPLNNDGTLKSVELYKGERYSGLELMQRIGMLIRSAFAADTDKEEHDYAVDYFLYLWCGTDSPLFDKSKMATFERYFLTDRDTYKEEKGNYFKLRDNAEVCDRILDAFGVSGSNRHIINGHVPVHASKGENPIKAGGRLMVIDGGFSEAYHKETGIAGYTLVYHSRGFQLVQHEPFTSAQDAINRGTDIKSTTQIVEMSAHRMLVADTDKGVELKSQINDLKELLYAYRHGYIKEKRA